MSALEDLLAAIKRKDASAVTRALDADGQLATARAASGQTPAIVAIYWRAPEMLALLRARGAALDVFEAAAAGDADRVRTLLDANGSLRDAHAPDGWTPLHLAGHFRQSAVIDLLLARGADVNAVSHNADANAPLHEAAAVGNADVVRMLLEAGAQPDARNGQDHTPAELACDGGHVALADDLDAAARRRAS